MDQEAKLAHLANSIKAAKRVMDKVGINEGGNPSGSTGGRRVMSEEDVDAMLDNDNTQYVMEAPQGRPIQQAPPTGMKNLNNSKMPQAILQSFMENPISDPTASVDMNRLAEKINEGRPAAAPAQQRRTAPAAPAEATPAPAAPAMDLQLLEFVIKKTVEATVAALNERTTIDENFQIKIGDKVFGGKLTVLNENKKPTPKKK